MQKRILKARKHRFDLSKRPLIMGVLNITPDSFSDGGRYLSIDSACRRAMQIQAQGADILDIGGQSTRPGSMPVGLKEELDRVMPVIERIKNKIKIPVSIDTTKYEVALAALKQGASMLNDVSGLHADPRLADLCIKYSAALVIMHIKGKPQNMQKRPYYKSLLHDIKRYLEKGIGVAESAGLSKECIILDPGIGFGKTSKHNLVLIKNIPYFKKMGFPLMIGVSRKSFLGSITGLDISERLIPTVAANALAVYNGADIIRVHDIEESVMALKVAEAIKKV
jgi:dihydropteroate synthase